MKVNLKQNLHQFQNGLIFFKSKNLQVFNITDNEEVALKEVLSYYFFNQKKR
jgi:hypothetical protein